MAGTAEVLALGVTILEVIKVVGGDREVNVFAAAGKAERPAKKQEGRSKGLSHGKHRGASDSIGNETYLQSFWKPPRE